MFGIRFLAWAAIAAVVTFGGCGPAVSTSNLGKIEYEVPEVPGAEKPYVLPEPKKTESRGTTAPSALPLPAPAPPPAAEASKEAKAAK